MAQRDNGRKRNGSDQLSGREVVARVRRDLPQLMGRPIESVLGLERDEDDGWSVTVQIVELARVPNSTDVLGAYAVKVDGEGEVIGWRRSRRYHRNQADED